MNLGLLQLTYFTIFPFSRTIRCRNPSTQGASDPQKTLSKE